MTDNAGKHGSDRQALKILAVDDDGLILMNIVALLEDLGHEVIEARSGEAALALVRETADLDLLITDQAMGGMTGLELARSIADERGELPVILSTGYGSLLDDIPAGMTILAKPFDSRELASALAKALARRS